MPGVALSCILPPEIQAQLPWMEGHEIKTPLMTNPEGPSTLYLRSLVLKSHTLNGPMVSGPTELAGSVATSPQTWNSETSHLRDLTLGVVPS